MIRKRNDAGIKARKFRLWSAVNIVSIILLLASQSTLGVTIAGIPDAQGSVNSLGAYTYHIPIKVAPGLNGLTPELSLGYDSQRTVKGSPLGLGWGLHGLSEIHRCGKTLAQEGQRGGVKYNEDTDRLCKDGVPLVSSNTYNYWSSNSAYHSVQEDWVKIVPIGACFEGPCSFLAYTKDRRVLEYGKDISSRSTTLQHKGIGRWHLNKITDANGNEIIIKYVNAGENSLVVDNIQYPLSDNVIGKITFDYSNKEAKHWVSGFYSDGENSDKYSYKKRLNTITVSTNNTVFKKYHLTYVNSRTNHRSLLTQVKECNRNSDCLEPIEFEWNNYSHEQGQFQQVIPSLSDLGISKTSRDSSITNGDDGVFNGRLIMGAHQGYGAALDYGVQIIPGDWNADGKIDFIRQEYCANPIGFSFHVNEFDADSYCYGHRNVIQDGNGFGFHISNGDGTFRSHYPNDHGQQNNHVGFIETHDHGETYAGTNIIPGDFNGDGHLDYIRQAYGDWAVGGIPTQVFLNDGYSQDGFPQFKKINQNERQDVTYLRGKVNGNGVSILPGDFDGNGQTDFIRLAEGDWVNTVSFAVYLSDGDGTFSVIPGNSVVDDVKGLHLGSGINLITGDFNGDGRTDFLRQEFGEHAKDTSNNFSVYFSIGDGTFTKTTTTLNTNLLKGSYGDGEENSGAILVTGDYNGDGLTDFIRQEHGVWANDSNNNFQVYFSKGDGDFDIVTPSGYQYQVNLKGEDDYEEPLAATRHEGWRNRPNDYHGANLITADFNGDGMTDFIRQETREWAHADTDKTIQVYLSRGDGYFDIVNSPNNSELQTQLKGLHWYQRNNHHLALWLRTGTTIIPGDYDGDGRADFIAQKWDSGTEYDGDVGKNINAHIPPFSVWFNPNREKQAANVIKLVRKGRLEHHITYAVSTDLEFLDGDIPNGFEEIKYPLWLVTQLIIEPEEKSESALTDTINYQYGHAIRSATSPLLGFTSIESNYSERNISKTTEYKFLETNNVALAQPSEIITKSGAAMIQQESLNWQQVVTGNDTVSLELSNKKTAQHYGNGDPVSKTIDYSYDQYSNLIKETHHDGDHTSSVVTKYNYNESRWVIAEIQSLATASGACSVSGHYAVCDAANKVKETQFTYYENNTGNVKNKVEVVSWFPYRTEITSYQYYPNGKTKSVNDPANITTHYSYESSGFIETTKRSIADLFEETSVDLRWGLETSFIDFNGYESKKVYDDFGRLAEIYKPNEEGDLVKFQDISRYWESANEGDLLKERAWIKSGWNKSYNFNTYYDVLGNKVKERKLSGTNVFSERVWLFNDKGQLINESLTGKPGNLVFTSYQYDNRGRLIKVSPPTGQPRRLTYTTNSGLCADNQVAVEVKIGVRVVTQCKTFDNQVVKVIHDPYSSAFTQTTIYDVLGNVLETNDDSHNMTTAKYDGLGRQIEKYNTERGTEQFTYNSLGQLASWRHLGVDNSVMGSATYLYNDKLGRRTKESYSDQRTIDYGYDDVALANSAGRLSRVVVKQGANQIIEREFSYYPTSEIKAMTVNIEGSRYGFSYFYTPLGEREKIFYPEGRVASYAYDDLGHLKSIKSNGKHLVSYQAYSSTGDYKKAVFGNGVTEEKRFDEYGRLHELDIGTDNADLLSQDIAYNNYGEIAEISDRLVPTNSQSYTYNEFGYLKTAQGPWPGTLNYEYDANGNIKKKEGKTYQYTENKLTSISGNVWLEYNKAGGVKTKRVGIGKNQVVTHYQYNSQQRLDKVTKGGKISQFSYDNIGQRIKKREDNGRLVYYVAPEYEVFKENGKQWRTAYIMAPSGRITSFTPKDSNASMLAGFSKHQHMTNLYSGGSALGLANKAYHGAAMLMNHPNMMTVMLLAPSVLLSLLLLWFVGVFLRSVKSLSLLGRLRVETVNGLAKLNLISEETLAGWREQYGTEFVMENRRLAMGVPVALMAMFIYLGLPGVITAVEAAEGDPAGNQYYHSNTVGSTTMVTNCNGGVMAQPTYKPFGEVYAGKGSKPYRYGFGGKEVDQDTNLHYFESRYYDADIGRFLQADGRAEGTNAMSAVKLNRYAYALNNPVNFADPSGEAVTLAAIFALNMAKIIAFGSSMVVLSEIITARMFGREMNWKSIGIGIATVSLMAPILAGVPMAFAKTIAANAFTGARLSAVKFAGLMTTASSAAMVGSAFQQGYHMNHNDGSWSWEKFGRDTAFNTTIGIFAAYGLGFQTLGRPFTIQFSSIVVRKNVKAYLKHATGTSFLPAALPRPAKPASLYELYKSHRTKEQKLIDVKLDEGGKRRNNYEDNVGFGANVKGYQHYRDHVE